MGNPAEGALKSDMRLIPPAEGLQEAARHIRAQAACADVSGIVMGVWTVKRILTCVLLSALLLLPAGFSEQYYRQITQEEALRILDEETDYILLDVRTGEEYDEEHIPGAINIDNEDIGTDALTELPDKDQLILVYCRSGRRSKEAAEKLAALGYTQVVEFGGILTWPGEVVSTAEEELRLDDPFEAHEYGDPEDFYEDWGDNFDDYEEAEEYYYEHGGWAGEP